MMKRGGASFAILFIINPIVILFYQNCSVVPVHSKNQAIQEAQVRSTRQVASVTDTDMSEPNKCRFLSSNNSCAE